jgi:hypothetical protein
MLDYLNWPQQEPMTFCETCSSWRLSLLAASLGSFRQAYDCGASLACPGKGCSQMIQGVTKPPNMHSAMMLQRGRTPLHYACEAGNLALLQVLFLEHHARTDITDMVRQRIALSVTGCVLAVYIEWCEDPRGRLSCFMSPGDEDEVLTSSLLLYV